jgi:hypothetical protein
MFGYTRLELSRDIVWYSCIPSVLDTGQIIHDLMPKWIEMPTSF